MHHQIVAHGAMLEKRIPLNSLVFCEQESSFPSHEHVSMASIERDLIGDRRPELSAIVFEELQHRVQIKLRIGERVIVSDHLSNIEKQKLTLIATRLGALTVDADANSIPATRPMMSVIASNWNGITVVGDIHGNLEAFREAARWAKSRRNFMWLLGDIIDYGAETLATMTSVYHTVMSGEASMILGNHERKIARWLDEAGSVRLSDGNKVTTQALARLSHDRQQQWIGQFRSLLAHCSLLCTTHDMTFIHGAVHPSFWSKTPDDDAVENYALYGESEHKGKRYRRTYRWVDQVPKGQTVIVGHDVMHIYPLVKTGAKGGQIVFLDTGCGKGGSLSSADLRFSDGGLHLECFKRY
jgi:predicted phosphodiesterase